MADRSKFLKWQDTNGNMIPDVCPDDALPRVNKCLPCSPNPWAVVPKWKEKDQTEPFLNEKLCKYQVSFLTRDTTLMIAADRPEGGDVVQDWVTRIFEHYIKDWTDSAGGSRSGPFEEMAGAATTLLSWKSKAITEDSIQKIIDNIEFTEYYLAPNPGSSVQLLYSIPFETLENMEEEGPVTEEPPPEPGDITVKMSVSDMVMNNIKVRKGLFMYHRYNKVYQVVEGATLRHEDDGRIFNLEDYGDYWPWDDNSHLAGCMNELDDWMNGFDINIPNHGWPHWFTESAQEIEFKVTGKYKLKSIKIWTDRCNEVPIYFGRRKVNSLKRRRAWRNPTAVAFFLRIADIEKELSARVEKPWLEVLTEYTYPKIYPSKPILAETSPGQEDGNLGGNIPTCLANALGNEFKELGQDIFDTAVMSIGDAVAYAFHKNLCRYSQEEVDKDLADLGHKYGYPDPARRKELEDKTSMSIAAMTQAYSTVDPGDQVFAHFCLRMMAGRGGSPLQMMDDMWSHNFERVKLCGLFDLLMSAMACLTKGLSLRDALMVMLKNAMKSMVAEDFGTLFDGLPEEKRQKLEELVKKNLESGKTFNGLLDNVVEERADTPGTTSTQTGVVGKTPETKKPVFGKIKFTKPWKNKDFVKQQNAALRENGMGNMVPTTGTTTVATGAAPAAATRRTLAQKLDVGKVAKDELDPNTVMDAYIIAILELFSDDLLMLLDRLNDFPGAQIIAQVLSTLDCPMPPLFNPGIADFLKSIVFPFCRNKNEITLPRFEDPRLFWPKLADIWGIIYEFLWRLLIMLVIKIIRLILVKICQIIGDAICKALEIAGTTLASLPDVLQGKKNLFNVIKESICGPEASDKEIESVVLQLVADLGVGGQALSNPDRAIAFVEDISASATQNELVSAMLGQPSTTFLRITDQIVENGYPDYRDALPNEMSIGRFFKNIGFLVPAEMRNEMKMALDMMDPSDDKPVNPTLCATPEDRADFAKLRCALLEGRASEEDCEYFFDQHRGDLLQDLDDVTNLMQKGIGVVAMESLPPLVSDPGCDNGMIPFENDSQIAIVNSSNGGDLKKLKMAFSRDMLGGESSFWGGGDDSKWGLLNMMLSDTLGNPYTIHQQKTENDSDFVDFYTGWEDKDGDDVSKMFDDSMSEGIFPSGMAGIGSQRGAYPKYVGEWLMYQYQMAGGSPSSELNSLGLAGISADLKSSMQFSSTNIPQARAKWGVSFDQLGFGGGLFGIGADVDLTDLPQMGYNTKPVADYDNDKVWFLKKARKDEPDIKLVFKDNDKGHRIGTNRRRDFLGNPKESSWSYQFRVSAFFSDMIEAPGSKKGNRTYMNRPDDNIRIYISDWYNMASEASNFDKMNSPGLDSAKKPLEDKDENAVISSRRYEFLGVDNGLDSLYDGVSPLQISDFPSLETCFERQSPYAPQINMVYDLLKLNGSDIPKGQVEQFYNNFMEAQFKDVAKRIGDNEDMWLFGAAIDTLDMRDFDYVCPDNWKQPGSAEIDGGAKFKTSNSGDPLQYAYMEVPDYDDEGERDGSRLVTNDDAVLGMSRNEWVNRQNGTHPQKTRVFMLNPGKYGGTFTNPPMYAKPMQPTGWSGAIDILFPANSMCEPKITDIVDFGDIKKKINETYPSIPEDTRLKGDPDCVVEVPYNRILNRMSKASIEGIISATIRSYASAHFVKNLPLFTVFAPLFPDNYSNVFSAYIIEVMESALREADTGWLNPFKSDEFWLAFLEQSVQTYARRVDNGDIAEEDVPKDVVDALNRLNNKQADFDYPFGDDLWRAKGTGDAAIWETLKSFREEKNLEAILKTQRDAKLVMKELVNEQLEQLSKRFMANLAALDMYPQVTDLHAYFMMRFCAGNTLYLEGRQVEKPVGLPYSGHKAPDPVYQIVPVAGVEYNPTSFVVPNIDEDSLDSAETSAAIAAAMEDGTARIGWPGPFYSNGGEFSSQDGRDYVGYYHGHKNEESGQDEYFVGEFVTNNEPDKQIRPFAEKLIVGMEETRIVEDLESGQMVWQKIFNPIGDVQDWSDGVIIGLSQDTPFYLRKYVSIDGVRYNQADAVAIIREANSGNLSDHWPGDMMLILDDEGTELGVSGNLGVKYGMEMGTMMGGTIPAVLSNVEISALDVPVTAFAGITENSKLLYCLIALMQRSQGFKLLVDYGFSLKKVLGVMAIYQDLGMLPSIGEVTVGTGALHGDLLHSPTSSPADLGGSYDSKPGGYGSFTTEEISMEYEHWLFGTETEDVLTIVDADVTFTPGWVAEDDRNGFWASLFFRKWDEWDQIGLRNTARISKRLFQKHYRSRDFGVDEDTSADIVLQGINIMKEKFRIQPGMAFLPWWRKNRLRANPFNAEGELCKKKD
jgi:hypothetical protein